MSEILGLLSKCIDEVATMTAGYSEEFSEPAVFLIALQDCYLKIEQGDNTAYRKLALWFAPSCDWDDFNGSEKLGSQVFNITYDSSLF